jgi:hypothetical protein
MKRSEKIYAEVTKKFKAGELGEELMKESAWQGWFESAVQNWSPEAEVSLNDPVQQTLFEIWWNEEISEPTGDS